MKDYDFELLVKPEEFKRNQQKVRLEEYKNQQQKKETKWCILTGAVFTIGLVLIALVEIFL